MFRWLYFEMVYVTTIKDLIKCRHTVTQILLTSVVNADVDFSTKWFLEVGSTTLGCFLAWPALLSGWVAFWDSPDGWANIVTWLPKCQLRWSLETLIITLWLVWDVNIYQISLLFGKNRYTSQVVKKAHSTCSFQMHCIKTDSKWCIEKGNIIFYDWLFWILGDGSTYFFLSWYGPFIW